MYELSLNSWALTLQGSMVTLHIERYIGKQHLAVGFTVALKRMGHRLSHEIYKDFLPTSQNAAESGLGELADLPEVEQAVALRLQKAQTKTAGDATHSVEKSAAHGLGRAFELGVYEEEEVESEEGRASRAGMEGGGDGGGGGEKDG